MRRTPADTIVCFRFSVNGVALRGRRLAGRFFKMPLHFFAAFLQASRSGTDALRIASPLAMLLHHSAHCGCVHSGLLAERTRVMLKDIWRNVGENIAEQWAICLPIIMILNFNLRVGSCNLCVWRNLSYIGSLG